LTTLASSAGPLSFSVYRHWPMREQALGRLLRWFPTAPIGVDLRSFIPLFCHLKAWLGSMPRCPWCDGVHTFHHFHFECQALLVRDAVVAQFVDWLGYPADALEALWTSPLAEKTSDRPDMECWNVAVWFARRALYSTCAFCHVADRDPPSLPVILAVWQKYLREFLLQLVPQSNLAERFSCGGKWLRRTGTSTVVSLSFLPIAGLRGVVVI
jgi:hypothetical protein